MTIKQFKDYLQANKDGLYYGDYHTIHNSELLDFINNYQYGEKMKDDESFNEAGDFIEKYQELISEQADSNTPIYNHNRAEWFAKNWSAVDDYIEETGTPEKFDIMEVIGQAYCYTYERDFTHVFTHRWNEAEESLTK